VTHSSTKPSKDIARAEAKLAAHALAFPGVREDAPWGHRAFKIKEKVFLFLGADADGLSLSLKLPVSGHVALMLPFAEPTGYGLGKSGWVSAQLGPKDDVPVEMLLSWIDESFSAIAPKRLLKELAAVASAPPVAIKKKAPKKKAPPRVPAKRKRSGRKASKR